jgi:lysophospholipase L1-like esterase
MSTRGRALGGAAIAGAAFFAACSEREVPTAAPVITSPKVEALDAAFDAEDTGKSSDAGASDADGPDAKPARGRYRSVLHLGDSMVGFRGGLTRALENRFQDAGTRFYSSSLTSAGIASFDESDHMEKLLTKLHPEMVIVTLGMNNVTYPHPEALRHNIVSIVKKIAPRDCYWIGPPAWKPDAALVKVLAESTSPCTFFDSSDLKLERQTDGIHPTERGGEVWADAFWLVLPPVYRRDRL